MEEHISIPSIETSGTFGKIKGAIIYGDDFDVSDFDVTERAISLT